MRYDLKFGKLKDFDNRIKDLVLMDFPFKRNFPDVEQDEAIDGLLNADAYIYFLRDEPVCILYFNEFKDYDGCFIHFARLHLDTLDFCSLIQPTRQIFNELLDNKGKFKYNNIYGYTPYGTELYKMARFFGFSVVYKEIENGQEKMLFKKGRY